jgi:NAD(P)-dependent dehydrogenase (short-subunit alcohol dehydrogenase family)
VRESLANIVAKTGQTEAQARDALVAHNPQKKMIQPDEVAQAVMWLCSEAAASVNGQSIAVDGGETM